MNKSGSCGSSSTSSSSLRLSISVANEQCVVSFIIPTSAYESTCSERTNYNSPNSKSLKSKGNKGHFKKKARSHTYTSKYYMNDTECISLYKTSNFDDSCSTSLTTDSPIPKKRMCIRSSSIDNISEAHDHSCFNDKALNRSQAVSWKEVGGSLSSCNYDSESETPRRLFELDLNLPSSTVRHFISTNKPSPVRPSIVTINNRYKVLKKTKRKNKVCPYDALDSTGSSLRISTINHTRLKNEECWRDLTSKYYKEFSEVSSNNASTPPCNVSTCASQSSSSSSAGLKQNSSTNFLLKVRSEEIFAARPSHNCIEVFNPIFSSSLEVPRKFTHSCEFPAITKVTTSFNNYEYNNDEEEELNRNEMCYSEIAQKVIHDSVNADNEIRFTSDSETNTKHSCKTLTRLASIRKEQANQITFYVAPSTDSGSISTRKYDIESIAEFSDDERERGCCTCFFPKSNAKYFT